MSWRAEGERQRDRESMCVRERERLRVCVFERERVLERERESKSHNGGNYIHTQVAITSECPCGL